MMNKQYEEFLEKKSQIGFNLGFESLFMPDFLFDFQKQLVEWAIRKGRCGIFADCGLGKSPMQLVWAENIVQKTNGNVLIGTPLSVSHQTIREAEKFGIEAKISKDGQPKGKITVTNYEKLHLFDSSDYAGFVCDESGILKNFDGARKKIITEFIKKMKYRLLCTATAAPNDFIELGTSSEALGVMGFMDMLNYFFKNDQNTSDTKGHTFRGGNRPKWRFKRHAEDPFWRWVCSWAMAIRKPSDIGFDDSDFILPELIQNETVIECSRPLNGGLLALPAVGLAEQRQERRATLTERCEMAAEKISNYNTSVAWCHLNDEADLLEKLIPDSKQVSGRMSDDEKEEIFIEFSKGNLKKLITKPRIGAFGMNWQHCSHTTFFPSHSFEQWYQGVRRFWRFGQTNPVTVDIITTQGELNVLENLKRKANAADRMFSSLIGFMNNSIKIDDKNIYTKKEEIPEWV